MRTLGSIGTAARRRRCVSGSAKGRTKRLSLELLEKRIPVSSSVLGVVGLALLGDLFDETGRVALYGEDTDGTTSGPRKRASPAEAFS